MDDRAVTGEVEEAIAELATAFTNPMDRQRYDCLVAAYSQSQEARQQAEAGAAAMREEMGRVHAMGHKYGTKDSLGEPLWSPAHLLMECIVIAKRALSSVAGKALLERLLKAEGYASTDEIDGWYDRLKAAHREGAMEWQARCNEALRRADQAEAALAAAKEEREEYELATQATIDALSRINSGYQQREETLRSERDALAKFKSYVHARLDAAGIPTHPDGPHSKEGCRVGDRLDLLVGGRDAALVLLGKLADEEPPVDIDEGNACYYCGVRAEDEDDPFEGRLEFHMPACAWRQARELVLSSSASAGGSNG